MSVNVVASVSTSAEESSETSLDKKYSKAESIPFTSGNLQFVHVLRDVSELGDINCLLQDKQGFIWLGGEDGLARYDGYDLETYHHDPDNANTLTANYVEDMTVDRQGRLWVATSNGLNVFDDEMKVFRRFYHNPHDGNSLSGNKINTLFIDVRGDLWIGTSKGLDRFVMEMNTFVRYPYYLRDNHGVSEPDIRAISEDVQNNIWVGTGDGVLNKYNLETGKATYYPRVIRYKNAHISKEISSVLIDREGLVWVGTQGAGLSIFDPDTEAFNHFPERLDSTLNRGLKNISKIIEDNKNNIWVATDGGGLQLFNRDTYTFSQYLHNPNLEKSIISNTLNDIFEDNNQNLWVSGHGSNVDLVNFNSSAIKNYNVIPEDDRGLRYNAILSFSEDKLGNLWVGTEGGLNYVDRASGKFLHYAHNPRDKHSIPASSSISVLVDSQERVWVGTWGGGLSYKEKHKNKFIPITLTYKGYNPENTKVWKIYEDTKGVIWAGSQAGLFKYYSEKKKFEWQGLPGVWGSDPSSRHVWGIVEIDNKLWLGTNYGIVVLDENNNVVKRYRYKPNDPNSISSDLVRFIGAGTTGAGKTDIVWIGTPGYGLNRLNLKTDKITRYFERDGLPGDEVTAVLSEDNGVAWIATATGLARYNPDEQMFRAYDHRDGFSCNGYWRGAALRLANGDFAFGCNDGFSIFNPQQVAEHFDLPSIVITELKIFKKTVKIGAKNSPLDKAIERSSQIVLPYNQSTLTFVFSALSYIVPEKNQYAYLLEGFDKEWNIIDRRREATYTNLDPGRYTLHVRGASNMGIWSKKTVSLDIEILPPWWKAWWAYVGYSVAVISFIIIFIKLQRNKVKIEKDRAKYLEELSVLKDKFLANTSHELRTPLNGIIGLAESLQEGGSGELPKIAKRNLSMIISSGNRLANLVNEILDFSDINNKTMVLDIQAVDLFSLVDLVIVLAEYEYQKAEIEIENKLAKNLPCVSADPEKLQQILHHLVVNAIKYTDRGYVRIDAEAFDNEVVISISDTGIGISPSKIRRIFESFEQIDSSDTQENTGAGLGLTVTRQLVDLHGGSIGVESSKNKGSRFYFTLPVAPEKEDEQSKNRVEITKLKSMSKSNPSKNMAVMEKANLGMGLCGKNERILLVDDEPVNRLVLKNYLEMEEFHIHEAEDVKQARSFIETTSSLDLIVLDIMMPGISGFEFCMQMREHYSKHELPIIFITAKNQVADLVNGFKAGGNDFVVKPVSRDELIARVRLHLNLLHSYRRMVSQDEN